ncbi:MAG: hypothetical protein AB7S78_09075 [Candidatus Omnitrophota bacterium]
MRCWLIVLGGMMAALVSVTPGTGQDVPPFVVQLIERFESAPTSNPPASVWRYKYKGRLVYYVPPVCCDVPSALYDTLGNLVCSPDGGLTGRGDGKCPDFFDERTEELRIWHDPRNK